MAWEVVLSRDKLHKIVLQEGPEGTYVLIFESESSGDPEQDHFQADLSMGSRSHPGITKFG